MTAVTPVARQSLDRSTSRRPPVICYVRFTSILLKNSNFRGDHNSEDRWQPRWKFPWGLSGATDFSAYDPLLALAVASTRGDNAFRAEVGFSRHLNFRLFQQYPSTPAVSFAQIAVIAKRCGERVKSTEAVSKLRKIFRPAARSEDFHNFFVPGRSQGSKKRTK